MRKAIYQYLTNNCQISDWYQPNTATASTSKPYGVIQFAEEVLNPTNRRTSFQDITLWIYRPEGKCDLLDGDVADIRGLFGGERLLTTAGGKRFFLVWQQTSRDFYDEDLKAVAKRIDFTIPKGGR